MTYKNFLNSLTFEEKVKMLFPAEAVYDYPTRTREGILASMTETERSKAYALCTDEQQKILLQEFPQWFGTRKGQPSNKPSWIGKYWWVLLIVGIVALIINDKN